MHDFILNIDNKEILNEILHHSVDYLIESPKTNSPTTIKFSNKFGFLKPEEFQVAIKFIATIYKEFVLKSIPDTELIAHFTHLNGDLQQSVIDVINTRRTEVEHFLIAEYNSAKVNLLQSFDWNLKWIMGTNNLSSYRQQLCTIILNCRCPSRSRPIIGNGDESKKTKPITTSKLQSGAVGGGGGGGGGGNQIKTIFFEMNRKKLLELIQVLENCQKQLLNHDEDCRNDKIDDNDNNNNKSNIIKNTNVGK